MEQAEHERDEAEEKFELAEEWRRKWKDKLASRDEQIRKLKEALRVIAGGFISRANGGPDYPPSADDFRHAMWKWSHQKIARAALRDGCGKRFTPSPTRWLRTCGENGALCPDCKDTGDDDL